MQKRADVCLKMRYIPGVGHRVEELSLNKMKLDNVVNLILEADGDGPPLMTLMMLVTDLEITGECPIAALELSEEELEEMCEEDEDEELDPEREFRN